MMFTYDLFLKIHNITSRMRITYIDDSLPDDKNIPLHMRNET